MYGSINKLAGSTLVTVSGAFPAGFINACVSSGIEIMSCEAVDDFTLRIRIPYRQLKRLKAAAERSMCEVESERPGREIRAAARMRARLLPAVCMLLLTLLLIWSKVYVWEIEVSGNETVPTGKILAALDDCGVRIGSFWPAFTSDNIRSQVLVKLPELSWITVNIYGSRAQVLVRERISRPEMIDDREPADIYAEKDGFIIAVRALKGREQVSRGQAVTKGELLVSGAVEDITGDVHTVHSYGSVTARTYYELSARAPAEQLEKVYTGSAKSRWSLMIGDQTINFFRNSSIYEEDCDKIYSVYKLEVKGLFSLPVALIRQTCRYYSENTVSGDANIQRLELEQVLHERLLGEIGAGEIISENFSAGSSDGVLTVCLRAECQEDIGGTVPMDEARLWEIGQKHAKEGTS